MGWLGNAIATPVVYLKDMATTAINKVRVVISTVGKLVAKPVIAIKDGATNALNKVKTTLRAVGSTVAKPFVALKDKASPIIDKLKSGLGVVGRTIARAAVAIKDGASKVLDKIKGGLKGIGGMSVKAAVAIKDAASAGLEKIKSLMATLAKGVTIGVGLAGAGITASLMAGADLQQSIGGVETLFKGDAGTVKANADKAFQTAGLSANDYMEQVTSFSASLLQSLGGDTTKAAGIADMAIIDMADNANKFGSSIDSIQNAYQGFAKQNYTMLDNLKLGYGGTKEEMERLLKDASKLSGQKYDLSNLSDVYNAIHVVQESLGVTGTTAKEAAETFSGSFASMKAAASNLLGNLAIGGDVTGSMEALVETAATFVSGNLIPMVGNILSSLPDAISVGISNAAPRIGAALEQALPPSLFNFVTGLAATFKNTIDIISPVIDQFGAMFEEIAPILTDTWGGSMSESTGLIQGFADIVSQSVPIVKSIILGVNDAFSSFRGIVAPAIEAVKNLMPTIVPAVQAIIDGLAPIIDVFCNIFVAAIPVVEGIIGGLSTFVQGIMPIISGVFEVVGGVIQRVLGVIEDHMGLFQTVVEVVVTVVTTVWNALAPAISTVCDVLITILDGLLTGIETVFNFLAPYIEQIWNSISGFFTTAGETISTVAATLGTVFETLKEVVAKVFDAISDKVSAVVSAVTGWISGAVDAVTGFIDKIGGAVSAVGNFIGGGISKVGEALGFAYGKDRVPYNNYPAVLHEGEKVLTRNQADQYDRVMNTRGVELSPEAKPIVSSDSGGGNAEPTGNKQEITEVTQENKGTNITIEKLADTVVIEKEADVDRVVQDMVTKFRKLVPNMP